MSYPVLCIGAKLGHLFRDVRPIYADVLLAGPITASPTPRPIEHASVYQPDRCICEKLVRAAYPETLPGFKYVLLLPGIEFTLSADVSGNQPLQVCIRQRSRSIG